MTPRGGRAPLYHPRRHPKLTERQRFEIACGAILTQNTAWTNVVRALEGLQDAGALSVEGLLRLRPARLRALIRPSGYFNQKEKKLRGFAGHVRERRSGRLGPWLRHPKARAELLELWGIGPETADSILLYAGNRLVFVVDAYTRRIGQRLGLFRYNDYEAVRAYFERRLPRSAEVYQEFHALLVELAKRHCRKSAPLCAPCPLLSMCRHGRRRSPKACSRSV